LAVATTTVTLVIAKNNVIFPTILGTATTAAYGGGSQIIELNAGEYIDVRCASGALQNTNAATDQCISIERLSGPAVVQASETVSMSAYLNANANVNADNIIIFNTKEFDSHSAYSTSTGKFTVPVSGTYQVSTYVYGGSPGTSVGFFVWKNDVKYKIITWQNSGTNSAGTILIKLNAGENIDIRPDTGAPRVITGGALSNVNCSYIQVNRVGN